jgi:hypothetical protein
MGASLETSGVSGATGYLRHEWPVFDVWEGLEQLIQSREDRIEIAHLPNGDPMCALVVAGGVRLALTKKYCQDGDVLKAPKSPTCSMGGPQTTRSSAMAVRIVPASFLKTRVSSSGGKSHDVTHGVGGEEAVGRDLFGAFSKKGKASSTAERDDLMNGGTFTAANGRLPERRGADNAGVAWSGSRSMPGGGSCG